MIKYIPNHCFFNLNYPIFYSLHLLGDPIYLLLENSPIVQSEDEGLPSENALTGMGTVSREGF